jgi:hypothetical protein
VIILKQVIVASGMNLKFQRQEKKNIARVKE